MSAIHHDNPPDYRTTEEIVAEQVKKEIDWANKRHITDRRERMLRYELDRYPKPLKAGGPWWDRLLKGIWRRIRKRQNLIITDFIGDIVGYLHKQTH